MIGVARVVVRRRVVVIGMTLVGDARHRLAVVPARGVGLVRGARHIGAVVVVGIPGRSPTGRVFLGVRENATECDDQALPWNARVHQLVKEQDRWSQVVNTCSTGLHDERCGLSNFERAAVGARWCVDDQQLIFFGRGNGFRGGIEGLDADGRGRTVLLAYPLFMWIALAVETVYDVSPD